MNTTRIAELIHAGNFAEIPAAMEQSLSLGSQSFEQDIARLISEGRVQVSEGLAHADSSTNLMWRLQNGADALSPLASVSLDIANAPAQPITLTVKP